MSDLHESLLEFDFVDWFGEVFTNAPFMGELLFLSLLWVILGVAMFIHTQSVAVPFVISIIFAGLIAATVGGTVANFLIVAMLIIIPGVLLVLLMRSSR